MSPELPAPAARSARRPSSRRRASLLAAAFLLPAGVTASAACAPSSPSSFPDASDVTAAQAAWCEALAKVAGAGRDWEHMAACLAARTSASPAYLRGMAKCYAARLADDQAPDTGQVVADCNDEVTVQLDVPEGAGRDVIDARCERMLRCEKVAIDDCRRGIEGLEKAQRAVFTTTYNRAALHAIAECLSSSACEDDEEGARQACYQPHTERLVWFPG